MLQCLRVRKMKKSQQQRLGRTSGGMWGAGTRKTRRCP